MAEADVRSHRTAVRTRPPWIVGIAASAGGQAALQKVLSSMPPEFPAAVIVMLHLAPAHTSVLSSILARTSVLPVREATDRERLEPGVVYVAPPDHHVTVLRGRIALTDREPVNWVRPSADVLFESMASTVGAASIAVVLTGSGRDGAAGVLAVKEAGGHVLAQDEASSQYFGMP